MNNTPGERLISKRLAIRLSPDSVMKKIQVPLLFCLAWACAQHSAQAQGTFQDLGFEGATLSPIPPGQGGSLVPVADAIPGWTAYAGTNELTQILQNNLTLGSASVDILGPFWTTTSGIIEGDYTVVLQSGFYGPNKVSASISQIGAIPAAAKSLQFKASADAFAVSFSGQELSLIPIGSGANYTLYGADISQFVGQSGPLTITALLTSSQPDYFDSFVFSAQPVPEPAVLGLIGLGFLVFAPRRCRRSEFHPESSAAAAKGKRRSRIVGTVNP